jgi:hypothetical protein
MLFSPRLSLLARAPHAILPLALAASIIFIYVTFLSVAFATTCSPSFAWTALAIILVSFLWYLTLLSLWRACSTDPGTIPARVRLAFRGLAVEFTRRQHPEVSAPSTGSTASALVDERVALSVDSSAAASSDDLLESGFPRADAVRDGIYLRPGPHDPRWCRSCRAVKPPRAHHCSTCERCVLKMDHHCPWVGNCVGHDNYKSFFLLLVYGVAATLVVGVWWWPIELGHWEPFCARNEEERAEALDWQKSTTVFAALILNTAYFFMLILFVAVHAWLIASNQTTLESHFPPPDGRMPYSLGSVSANFKIVFGRLASTWGVPRLTTDVRDATCGGCDFSRTIEQAMAGDAPVLRDYPILVNVGACESASSNE